MNSPKPISILRPAARRERVVFQLTGADKIADDRAHQTARWPSLFPMWREPQAHSAGRRAARGRVHRCGTDVR